MNITERRGIVTLANGATTPLIVTLTKHTPIELVSGAYLTSRVLMTRPDINIATPITMTVTDAALPGRFVLVSRNNIPTNDLETMLFYDTKYGDMFYIPTLALYETSTYIAASVIDVDGIGINFSGNAGDRMPAPVLGAVVNYDAIILAAQVGKTQKGGYMERMVTGTTNLNATSAYPSNYIRLGIPSAFFGVLPVTPVDVNVMGYRSIFELSTITLGKQVLSDVDEMLVKIPLV